MSDYDDVRTCCKGASVCPKCWKFMVVAVQVVTRTLKEDFGLHSLLWVFSGRRGIHCWVCDEEALSMENDARSAIADYLSVYVGNEMTGGTATLSSPIHPSLRKNGRDIILPAFKTIMIEDQEIL